jgi:hypothetical protein
MMNINAYQIRNVLRKYRKQLKRQITVTHDDMDPVHSWSSSVDISIAARRRQVLSQFSTKLIARVSSSGQKSDAVEKGDGSQSLNSANQRQVEHRFAVTKTSLDYRKVAEAIERKQPGRIERVNQLKEAALNVHDRAHSSRVAKKMVIENLGKILSLHWLS